MHFFSNATYNGAKEYNWHFMNAQQAWKRSDSLLTWIYKAQFVRYQLYHKYYDAPWKIMIRMIILDYFWREVM